MNLKGRIQELANEEHLTLAELERVTGISNGQIRRWDKSSPKTENLQKVADHFNVSTDYLLGRTNDRYSLSNKEMTDVGKQVEALLNGLNDDSTVNFYGEPMTDSDKAELRGVIEAAMIVNKQKAKRRAANNKESGKAGD